MRYSSEHKRLTGERILNRAAALFRKRGYAATGVDAVMASANLTAGGFYAHFRSKEALLAQALDTAFRESTSRWPVKLRGLRGARWLRGFTSFYLSPAHRDRPDEGCPMPALAAEVARLDDASREVFECHLRDLLATVGGHLEPAQDSRHVIPAVALCVGGLMLARAVSDRAFSDQILSACRAAARGDRPLT